MTEGLVSVVIPCRNEVKFIRNTIEAILRSDYPKLEVLVVDGMSEDGTREVLREIAQVDTRVCVVDNVQKLTPYAFNLGVREACGEYVQIVGSRNNLSPDYISTLVEQLHKHPEVACIGGDFQHTYETPQGRALSLAMESKFGVGGGNYRTLQADAYVDTVGIPLCRRALFDQVGYFDERLTRNQDDDFNFRVRQAGLKIMYIHAAKATYLVRGSLDKAYAQFFQYGYFKVFVNCKHKEVTTLRQVVPALFVAFWILGLPLTLYFPKLSVALAAAALLYVGTGLLMAGRALGLVDRIRVLYTSFVLHWAYGLGYWQGMIDFICLKRSPRTEFQRQTT